MLIRVKEQGVELWDAFEVIIGLSLHLFAGIYSKRRGIEKINAAINIPTRIRLTRLQTFGYSMMSPFAHTIA